MSEKERQAQQDAMFKGIDRWDCLIDEIEPLRYSNSDLRQVC